MCDFALVFVVLTGIRTELNGTLPKTKDDYSLCD